jgi:hypothetical protein
MVHIQAWRPPQKLGCSAQMEMAKKLGFDIRDFVIRDFVIRRGVIENGKLKIK